MGMTKPFDKHWNMTTITKRVAFGEPEKKGGTSPTKYLTGSPDAQAYGVFLLTPNNKRIRRVAGVAGKFSSSRAFSGGPNATIMVASAPQGNAPKFIPNVVEGLSDFPYNTLRVNNRVRTAGEAMNLDREHGYLKLLEALIALDEAA